MTLKFDAKEFNDAFRGVHPDWDDRAQRAATFAQKKFDEWLESQPPRPLLCIKHEAEWSECDCCGIEINAPKSVAIEEIGDE